MRASDTEGGARVGIGGNCGDYNFFFGGGRLPIVHRGPAGCSRQEHGKWLLGSWDYGTVCSYSLGSPRNGQPSEVCTWTFPFILLLEVEEKSVIHLRRVVIGLVNTYCRVKGNYLRCGHIIFLSATFGLSAMFPSIETHKACQINTSIDRSACTCRGWTVAGCPRKQPNARRGSTTTGW